MAQRQGEESDQIVGVFNKRFVRICRLATAADERRTAAERRLWENLFVGKVSCETTMNQTVEKSGHSLWTTQQVHTETSLSASPPAT